MATGILIYSGSYLDRMSDVLYLTGINNTTRELFNLGSAEKIIWEVSAVYLSSYQGETVYTYIPPTGIQIRLIDDAIYIPGTEVDFMSAEHITISALNLDNLYYEITGYYNATDPTSSITGTASAVDSQDFRPKFCLFLDENYTSFVSISTVLGTLPSYCVPADHILKYVVSSPISAYFPKSDLEYYGTSFEGYAISADLVEFSSGLQQPSAFIISADDITEPLYSSTYTFIYQPILSQELQVIALSSQDFKTFLRLSNTINDTMHYNIISGAEIQWEISPTGYAVGLTGLTGYEYPGTEDAYFDTYIPAASLSGHFNFGDPGIAGSTGIYNLCSVQGYVSAVVNKFGFDYIEIDFDRTIPLTYTITGTYTDTTSADTYGFGVYQFTPNFPTSSVAISTLELDLQPWLRYFKLKAINNYDGYPTKINDNDYVKWIVLRTDSTSAVANIWAKLPNGLSYTFETSAPAITHDTLYFYITTDYFISDPQMLEYSICAQVITGVNTSDENVGPISNFELTIDQFPDPTIFTPYYRLRWNDTRTTTDVWLLTSVSAERILYFDTSIAPTDIVDVQYIVDWGDGNVTTAWYATLSTGSEHVYYPTMITSFPIHAMLSSVKAPLWLSAHSASAASDMTLHIVDRWLSGVFIAYPTYVLPTSSVSDLLVLDSTSYTQTCGVCAYGEGHTETFILSSNEVLGTTFRWYVSDKYFDGNQIDQIQIQTSINDTFNSDGSAISLSVFNSAFPVTMPSSYYDEDGEYIIYSNFKDHWSTDDSNKYYQNIRTYSYESPQTTIAVTNTSIVLPQTLNSTASLTLPNYSPVTINNGTQTWLLCSINWNGIYHSDINNLTDPLAYSFSVGAGTTPGTARRNVVTPVYVNISGIAQEKINSLDWNTDSIDYFGYYSGLVNVYVMPIIKIYPSSLILTLNEVVRIDNLTSQTPSELISAFKWDNGNNVISAVEGFDSVYFSYPTEGYYTITVSAIAFDGTVTSSIFTSLITVVSAYEEYDTTVSRTYQTGELKLPYDEVNIAPNEWVTSENINNCFDKLNANLTYLDRNSKMYTPPPTKYLGWLGTTLTGDVSTQSWHLVDVAGLSAESSSIESSISDTLSAVSQLSVKDDVLYIVNGTNVQILDTDYSASILTSRNYKTLGDYFVEISSMALDTDNRIYVLDKIKNRVTVLSYDLTTGIWKMLYTWGGLGGASASTKFQGPLGIYVDANNNVWVADTENYIIKKFSRTGGWIASYESDLLTGDYKPLSLTIDKDFAMHILTKDYVIKLDVNGNFISQYAFTNDSGYIPRKIITSYDKDFIYICTANKIIKFTKNGDFIGNIGTTLSGTKNFKDIYHDSEQNLYIANNINIVKYHDRIKILDTSIDVSSYTWNISDIYIDKNEYVQDWVYNCSFARMWDNIELFRRSIAGKIVLETNSSGELDLVIKGYTPQEYYDSTLITPKSSIFIGVNEFVTAPVINRCLNKLNNNIVKIKGLLE